jgi:hypothetical protein
MSDCIREVLAIAHGAEMPVDRTAVKAARHGRGRVCVNLKIHQCWITKSENSSKGVKANSVYCAAVFGWYILGGSTSIPG